MRTTIVVEPDSNASLPDRIEAYLHCSTCASYKPPGISPAQWSQLDVGFTGDGSIQVWCRRCNLNVALITVSLKESDT